MDTSTRIPTITLEENRANWVIRMEALFVALRPFLPLVHVVMFLFFGALMIGPLYLPEPTEESTFLNDFTRAADFLIWGAWFPLVFLSVVFTGRSWCGLLCPLGAASEWANKIGPKLEIPAWIRWEGTPILSFILVTIWGQTVGVRDHKEAIAIVFGSMFIAAFVIGFFFGNNKRAWCRHICPIGLLLGVFSRIGAIQFTPKIKKSGGDTYTEKGLCPTMIDLQQKEESRHCIECFRCVHPDAKGGLRLDVRTPGKEIIDIKEHNPNSAEVWFLYLATGSALGGFLWLTLPIYETIRRTVGEWFIHKGMYWIGEAGPVWLMSVYPERREVFLWLDFFMIVGFMSAVMIGLTIVLYVLTHLSTWIANQLSNPEAHQKRYIELGYQYAPIAMISLVVGLGGELFDALIVFGLNHEQVSFLKLFLFFGALVWSIGLGERILQRQGVELIKRPLVLIPSSLGSIFIALAWWPAIFTS